VSGFHCRRPSLRRTRRQQPAPYCLPGAPPPEGSVGVAPVSSVPTQTPTTQSSRVEDEIRDRAAGCDRAVTAFHDVIAEIGFIVVGPRHTVAGRRDQFIHSLARHETAIQILRRFPADVRCLRVRIRTPRADRSTSILNRVWRRSAPGRQDLGCRDTIDFKTAYFAVGWNSIEPSGPDQSLPPSKNRCVPQPSSRASLNSDRRAAKRD